MVPRTDDYGLLLGRGGVMLATEIPRRHAPQWPGRTADLEREWSRINLLANRITADGAVSADELGPEARCLLAMRGAALWSLG